MGLALLRDRMNEWNILGSKPATVAGSFDSKDCYMKKGKLCLPTINTGHGGVHWQLSQVTTLTRGADKRNTALQEQWNRAPCYKPRPAATAVAKIKAASKNFALFHLALLTIMLRIFQHSCSLKWNYFIFTCH